MTSAHEHAAELVQAAGRGLSAFAAETLLRRNPEIESRFGAESFDRWRTSFESHLDHLRTALRFGRPELFVGDLVWTKRAFVEREVPLEDLGAALDAMDEVLADELPEDVVPLVRVYLEAARESISEEGAGPESGLLDASSDHGRRAAEYLLGLLEGRRDRAHEKILELVHGGIDVREVYTEILAIAQKELGRMWVRGEVTVAEEHFATATTQAVMARLYPHISAGADEAERTVIAASVDGNDHDIGIRMVADFFELDGWKAIFLGSRVPSLDLASAVRDFEGDLVAVSVTLIPQIETLARLVRVLKDDPSTGKVPVLVGGLALRGTGDLWKRIGADGYAGSPGKAVELGRQLCSAEPHA